MMAFALFTGEKNWLTILLAISVLMAVASVAALESNETSNATLPVEPIDVPEENITLPDESEFNITLSENLTNSTDAIQGPLDILLGLNETLEVNDTNATLVEEPETINTTQEPSEVPLTDGQENATLPEETVPSLQGTGLAELVIHREQASGAYPGNPMPVRLFLYNNGTETITNLTIIEEFEVFWEPLSTPPGSRLTVAGGSIILNISIPSLAPLGMWEMNYTLRAPYFENPYTIFTTPGNMTSFETTVMVNSTRTWFDAWLRINSSKPRTLGTDSYYPATITVTNLGPSQDNFTTFLYWDYSADKWDIPKRLIEGCQKSDVKEKSGKGTLRCEWDIFDELESKTLSFWIRAKQDGAFGISLFNVTYDPPEEEGEPGTIATLIEGIGSFIRGFFTSLKGFFIGLFSQDGTVTGAVVATPPAQGETPQGQIEEGFGTVPPGPEDPVSEDSPTAGDSEPDPTAPIIQPVPQDEEKKGRGKGDPSTGALSEKKKIEPKDEPGPTIIKVWHPTTQNVLLRSEPNFPAGGNVPPVPLHIKDANGNDIGSAVKNLKNLGGDEYELELGFGLESIVSLKFNKIKLKDPQDFNLGLDDITGRPVKQIKGKETVNLFAIDPSRLNFTNATLTFVAEGRELYKCKEWDFQTRACLGEWVLLMETQPGLTYELLITPDDPGFAETGVATVNTKKSIYRPNETAEIIMTILNTHGHLITDASVSLNVSDPIGTVTTYSTYVGTIIETSAGIYEASHNETSIEGNYTLAVTATAPDTNVSFESRFLVQQNYPFDILREAPVSIDPWQGPFNSSVTLVSFTNVSSFDFEEVLPINFTVTDTGGASQTTINNTIRLTWKNLTNNSLVRYSIQAPLVTPDLYYLGPAIVAYQPYQFIEARPWYIAIDPVYSPPDGYGYSAYCLDATSGLLSDAANDNGAYFHMGRLYMSGAWGGWSGAQKAILEFDITDTVALITQIDVTWDGYCTKTKGLTNNMYIAWHDNATDNYNRLSNDDIACDGLEPTTNPSISITSSSDIDASIADDGLFRLVFAGYGGNKGCNDGMDIYHDAVTVTTTVAADIAPFWTNNATSISTTYDPAGVSRFNVSWNDSLGLSTIYIEHNFSGQLVNDSMNNVISNVYNFSTILGAGTYQWRSFANDTNPQWNWTDTWVFTVSKASPALTLKVDGSEDNITIQEDNSIWINATLDTGDPQNLLLYLNGSQHNIGTSPIANFTLFEDPQYVNVTLFYQASENYTALQVVYWINVTDNTPPNVTPFDPAPDAFDDDGNINFTYNVSDFSIVDNCSLRFSGFSVNTNFTINKTETNIFKRTNLANGPYEWNISCMDRVGLMGHSELRTVTVDRNSIGITLNHPDHLNWNTSNTVGFGYTATDTNLETCTLFHNATGWGANVTDPSTTSGVPDEITINIPDGHYIWNIICNDSTGRRNSSASNFTIFIDTVTPTLEYAAPTPDPGFNQSSQTVVVNVTHSEDNPDTLVLSWNGTNQSQTYDGADTSITKGSLDDGTYTYFVWVNDSAKWNAQTTPRSVTVDATRPQTHLESPQDVGWANTDQVTFTYNTSDNLLGVTNCSLIIDDRINVTNTSITEDTSQWFTIRLEDGNSYGWSVNCSDLVNNINGTASRTVQVDTTPGTISDEAINATDFDINVQICLNATAADTYSGVQLVKAQVDFPDSGLLNYTMSNATGRCGNAGGGSFSTNFSNAEEGSYNWTKTFITDVAGTTVGYIPGQLLNWTAISANDLNVTLLAPLSNLEINESESNTQYTQTCNASCVSGTCMSTLIYPQFNNGTWNDITTTGSQLTSSANSVDCGGLSGGQHCEGSFTITAGSDAGGNTFPVQCKSTSSTAPQTFSGSYDVQINDHPLAAFIYPTNGTWLRLTETLNASASTDDQNIIRYTFEVDDQVTFDGSTELCDTTDDFCSFNTITQSPCVDSTWNCWLRLNVSDDDGFRNSTIIQIGVDNTDPVVQLDSPPTGGWSASQSVTLAYIPTDTNLEACILFTNESGWADVDTHTTLTSGSQDSFGRALSDGYYIWNVLCNDTPGNTAFNATNFTLWVDATYPTIDYTSNTQQNQSFRDQDWVYIEVAASDPNEANITFGLYNSSGYPINVTTFVDSSRSINITGLQDTNEGYRYNVTIVDLAGNTNTTGTRIVTLDDTTPQISYGDGMEQNNTHRNRDWIFVNVSVSDTNFNNITFELHNTTELVNRTTYTNLVTSLNFTNLADTDEAYEFNVTVRDKVGLTNVTQTYMLTLDSTDPLVNLIEPANDTQTNNPYLQFNYTPSDTNLANCSLYFNFTGGWTINQTHSSPASESKNSFDYINITDGRYKWNVQCYDWAGNAAFNSTNYSLVVHTDLPDPFELVAPANNTYADDTTPYLEWQDSADEYFTNYTIWFDDDSEFSSIENVYVVTSDPTDSFYQVLGGEALADNTLFYWKVITWDSFNQSTESDSTFQYGTDNQFPDVYLESPAPAQEIISSSTVTFYYNVTDNYNIANCSLYIDGTSTEFDSTIIINTSQSMTATMTNGWHNWTVGCYDRAGHLNITLNRTININVAVPQLRLYETAAGTVSASSQALVNLSDSTEVNADRVTLGLGSGSEGIFSFVQADLINDATFGPNGLLIPSSTTVSFDGNFDSSNAPRGYAHWDLRYSIGAGFPILCKAQSTAAIPVTEGPLSASCTTTNENVRLAPGDQFRLIVSVNKTDTRNTNFYHDWDNPDNSGFVIFAYPLGNVDVNLSTPWPSLTINETYQFNASCNVTCTGGWCFDTKVYIQQNNSIDTWTDINETSGYLTEVLGANPVVVGNINDSVVANFSLRGNSITKQTSIRCRTESDYHNNTGSRTSAVTVWDTIDPSIQLNNPDNDTWDSDGSVTFSFTPNDNYNLSNCSIIFDNAINQTNTSPVEAITNSFLISGINDGSHNWSVNCTDSFANENSSIVRVIKVDSTTPQNSFAGGTDDNNSFRNQDWIYINVSAYDEFEANITFALHNSSGYPINITTLSAGNRDLNITNLQDTDEEYRYNVTIRDQANNENTTTTYVITLDTTNPSISFSGDTDINDSYRNRDWIFAEITADDANEANVTFRLYNSFGNLINVTTKAAGSRTLNFTGLVDTNEIYRYNVTILDKALNKNVTLTRVMTLDSNNPEIDYAGGTADNDTAWNRNWIYINVSGYDLYEANITFVIYNSSGYPVNTRIRAAGSRDFNFTNLQDLNEVYRYNATLTDYASNENTTATRYITLDNTTPKIRLDSPASGSWSSSLSNTFSYAGFDSNLDVCILYHNETGMFMSNQSNTTPATGVQGTFTITSQDGTLLWNVLCNDTASNQAFNDTNRTLRIDATTPPITFAGGTEPNASYRNRNWIYVNVSAYDPNEANITFRLYNSSGVAINTRVRSAGNRNFNFTNIQDTNERYSYNVTIEDYANNKNTTETYVLELDSTYPTIDYSGGTEPNNTYFNRDHIFINVTAQDDNEANITFRLYNSSGMVVNETVSSVGARSLNITSLVDTDERYSYNVSIIDKASNLNKTSTYVIILDSTDPDASFVSPTPLNNSNQSSYSFIINVTYTETNPDLIRFIVNDVVQDSFSYSGTYSSSTINVLSDGSYPFRVYLNDSAGNTFQTETWSVTIDSTPPTIDPISPDNDTWRNDGTTTITFIYQASDALLEIANCSLLIDGTINITNQTIVQDTNQSFIQTFEEKNYSWSLKCYDQVGNTETSTERIIKIDTTSPTVSGMLINDTNITITSYICLNATADDTPSGVDWVYASIVKPADGLTDTVRLWSNLTTTCDASTTDNVYTNTYRLSQVGEYNWSRTTVNDTAGNLFTLKTDLLWNSTSIGTITVNMTSPSADFELNESEEGTNYTYTQTCEAVCDDKPQNCTNVYLYAQYNLSGSSADITTSTAYLVNYNDSYFCGNLTAGGDSCSHTFTVRTSTDTGGDSWNVWCRAESDLVGSYISAEGVDLYVNDHPVAAFGYPSGNAWLKGTVTINSSDSTDDQGLSNFAFQLDNNTSFDSPSLLCDSSDQTCLLNTLIQSQCSEESTDCYLRLNVTDNDGLENSTILPIGMDNTAPTTIILQPVQGENITSTTFIVNASVTEYGIGVNATTFIYRQNNTAIWSLACRDPDGEAPYSCTWTISGLAEGTQYQVRAYANDSFGQTSLNDTITNITIDDSPPAILLESPSNLSWSKENVTFHYNVTDTTSDVANCSLYLNSTLNATNSSIQESQSQNFTVNGLIDGTHAWRMRCTDVLGSSNDSLTSILLIDTTAPTVTLLRPLNGTNISTDSHTLNASVSDTGIGVNATMFEYRVNPVSSWNPACTDGDGVPSYSCSWSTAALSDGNRYQIRVRANDSLGSFSAYHLTANITLDRVGPTITLISPTNNTRILDGSATFSYNVTDTTSSIINCSLLIDESITQTNTSLPEDTALEFVVTGLGEADYDWSVQCYDYAGNLNTSLSRNLSNHPDRDPPFVSLVAPVHLSFYTSENVIFRYNVTDVLTDISNCSLIIDGVVNATSPSVTEDITQSFLVPNVNDGNYTWSVNCTDSSAGYYNTGNSSTWNVTVQKTTNLLLNVSLDQQTYEQGEDANITTTTKNIFGGFINSSIVLHVVDGNTSVPWWNESFPYRSSVTVTNNDGETLQDGHTINITIDTATLVLAGKMRSDGADLRIAFWDNVSGNMSQLDRIISNMDSASTHVLFQAKENITSGASDERYYVYYGNDSLTDAPDNRSNVYFYFDGFSSDSLSSYNTTKGFHDASENLDSTLAHDSNVGQINYTGTSGKGKSLRLDLPAIGDAIIEADQYLDDMLGGPVSAKMELAGRINSDSYYSFYASSNIFDSKLYRYNEGSGTQLDTVSTQFTEYDTWHRLKLVIRDNTSHVFINAYVDGTPLLSANDTTASRLLSPGGFGMGSYQMIGLWENLSVRRFLSQEPSSTINIEESLVATFKNETGLDGIWLRVYETLPLAIGNYSAVAWASNPDYLSGAYGKRFRINPDTTPPGFSNVQLSDTYVWNFKDINISISIIDRARTISQAFIDGNWSGQRENDTAISNTSTSFTFKVSNDNLTSGEFVTYRFFANDTLGNTNTSSTYNFTVVRSFASLTVNNPAYHTTSYVDRSIWVNSTIQALNGSTNTCNVSVSSPAELALYSNSSISAGNLSNGSISTNGYFLFNATTPGTYLVNLSSTCIEGDSRNITTAIIEYLPYFTNVTNKLYAELKPVNGIDYFHLSAATEVDWWFNLSHTVINLNSTAPSDPWFLTSWYVVLNNTITYRLDAFTWDIMKIVSDNVTNTSHLTFSGRIPDLGLRMNLTRTIGEPSKFDNMSILFENYGTGSFSNLSLVWNMRDFDIGTNGDTDNLSLINVSGQTENHQMNGATSLSYGQEMFNTSDLGRIYFIDTGSLYKGYIYWEWNMTKDGVKSGFDGFNLRAANTPEGFIINLTFGFGSLASGSIAEFDPGEGIITPGLILRTSKIDSYSSTEASATYTDVTVPLTDDLLSSSDRIKARNIDTVEVFNILNNTEMTGYDEMHLLLYVASIDVDPYPVVVLAYNTDNVTVQTSVMANYTLTAVDVGTWVSINITDLAHLQDGYGWIRMRLAPNASEISNNKEAIIAEVRFNLTDRSPPAITLLGPINGFNTSNETVLFNFTVSDKVDAQVTCNLSVDGTDIADTLIVPNGTYYNLTRNVSDGTHNWNVRCIDSQLNVNTSVTWTFTVVGLVGNLSAYMDPDNVSVKVNWTAKPYADSYVLYISGNSSSFGPAPNVTGLTDNNYTDTSLAGVTQRYYKVGVVRDSVNRTSVEIVGKYTVVLQDGFNLVSSPLDLTSRYLGDESQLVNPAPVVPYGSIKSIYSLNDSNDTFVKVDYIDGTGWSPAADSGNFQTLNKTQGYWFETNQTANVTFLGRVSQENHSQPLGSEWTIVGWLSLQYPVFPNGTEPPYYPIEVSPVNSVSLIYSYDATADLFNKTDHYNGWGWVPASGSDGFTGLEPTRGYYFKAHQAANWTVESIR